jgi:Holliday junction resolvase-like predicted endonuclease
VAVGAFVVLALFAPRKEARMKELLQERGLTAAAAYLERCGIRVVDQNYETSHGVIPLVATDENTLVRIRIIVKTEAGPQPSQVPAASTIKKYHQQMDEYISKVVIGVVDLEVRYDDIIILALPENRALLRHYRGAY